MKSLSEEPITSGAPITFEAPIPPTVEAQELSETLVPSFAKVDQEMIHYTHFENILTCEKVFWLDREREQEKYMDEHQEVYNLESEPDLLKYKDVYVFPRKMPLTLKEYFYFKFDYFTIGMPLLYEFISGKVEKNQFIFNMYISNINRHGLLKHHSKYKIGDNIKDIIGVSKNLISTYKKAISEMELDISKEIVCQGYLYGVVEHKLFLKGNFLKVHKEIGRLFFDCQLNKREMIMLLTVFRLAQSYHKERLLVQLTAFPLSLRPGVIKKSLEALLKMEIISEFSLDKTRLFVTINPMYRV